MRQSHCPAAIWLEHLEQRTPFAKSHAFAGFDLEDRPAGRPIVLIAAALHVGMAEAVVADLERLAESNGVNTVVLSDGVWQNELLVLNLVVDEIASRTLLDIKTNALVLVSDGGISLGQAPIASRMAFR